METKLINLKNENLKSEILAKEIEINSETKKRKQKQLFTEHFKLLEKYLAVGEHSFNITYFMIFNDYKKKGKTTEQFFQWVEQRETQK